MALDYDQMRDWCRTHDLIINRCKVINAVVEDRATIEHPRGCDYRLVMMGCVVASWRWPDLDSVRDALSRADAAFEVLWTVRREGYASFC